MTTPKRLPLILLKTRSSPTDPYDDFFTNHPLHPTRPTDPIFVPVLNHHHKNLEGLSEILAHGGIDPSPNPATKDTYGCLIITSQRAVEALGACIVRLKLAGHDPTPILSTTPVFVVGPATASAVIDLGFSPDLVLGAECGNGAVLSEHILETLSGKLSHLRDRKILFLVGEIRRDIIPKRLGAAGIRLTEFEVYATEVVAGFEADLKRALRETEPVDGEEVEEEGARWVVVFSPQGADVAVEALKGEEVRGSTRVAAIGPTTEVRLRELGREVEVVADRPSPEGLWEAVKGGMGFAGERGLEVR